MVEEKKEKSKKKVTVRRRAASNGTIPVKHRSTKEPVHVVDLKHIRSSAPSPEVYSPAVLPSPVSTRSGRSSLRAYRRIAVSFIVLVLVSLAVVAYFALVRLDIDVTPKISSVNAAATFSVYDRPENYEVPVGSILGLVRETEVTYSHSYPATGEKALGAEVSGSVTLVNKYIKDQPLVATTRLLTPNNQLLRLKDTVTVPAGGSIEAEVYGETIDPSFTLADTTLTIPGLWAGLQDKIYAQAAAGSVSYKEQKELFVQQIDLDNAITEAKKALSAEVDEDISAAYPDYDQRLYKVDDQSVAFSFDAKVGDIKDELTITMSAKVIVVAFKSSSIAQLGSSVLESQLGSEQSLLGTNDTKPTLTLKSSDVSQNVAELELAASGQATVATADDLIDRAKLIGLTKTQIEAYLNSLPTVESYELHFRPSFLKVAPQLVDRITVNIK